jgi:O-antigen/teichoic acid export membrane protein
VNWKGEAAAFWRFAGARGLASTIALVTLLDVVLVGALDSAEAAAVYGAATRFVIVSAFLLIAISRPLAPRFSELIARDDRRGIERLYRVSTWWTVAAAWPAYLLLAVFAPVVMRIFGSSYGAGGTALAILSLGCLVDLGTGNVLVLLLMSGKSTWNLANSIGAVTLNVCLNVILIPRIGIAGAAIAWAASITLDCGVTLLQVVRLYGLRPFGRTYLALALGCVGCFGPVAGAARAAFGATPLALLISAVVGFTLYAGLLRRGRRSLALDLLWGTLRRPAAPTVAAPDRL